MDPATINMMFAIMGGALQLVDAGTAIFTRLNALQAARAAEGKPLTLADLNAEFDASELAAIENMSAVLQAQAAKRASANA